MSDTPSVRSAEKFAVFFLFNLGSAEKFATLFLFNLEGLGLPLEPLAWQSRSAGAGG